MKEFGVSAVADWNVPILRHAGIAGDGFDKTVGVDLGLAARREGISNLHDPREELSRAGAKLWHSA